MRIGVLTLPLHTNYGGILQAWALQTVLERMGHEVWLIQRPRPKMKLPLWMMPMCYSKRILQNLLGHKRRIFEEQYQNKCAEMMLKYTKKFCENNIRIKYYNNYSDISPNEYDVIVVGSGQVWRAEYWDSDIRDAFLRFTTKWDIRRISYAASFGKDDINWSQDQINDCKKLLHDFDAVSVREDSGVDICKNFFDVKAVQVLDPTSLLSSADYINLVKRAGVPKSTGTLHYYFLDETSDKMKLVQDISRQMSLKPFKVYSNVEDGKVPIEERIQPPVEKWLRAFYDAEFVVTDSFHACVFSIIFNKPFIVYGNVNRGLSRFHSLLNIFGLEDRLIFNSSDYGTLDPINFSEVNSILEIRRKESLLFLKQSIM